MKVTVKVEQEIEVKTLRVEAHVRYWCDATVNGVKGDDDEPENDLGIPCRKGEAWCPEIDIDSGRIMNWTPGTTASLHYKVCDAGVYTVLDAEGKEVAKEDGYVPDCMAPKGEGYGDYIKMDIDADGVIEGWTFDEQEFVAEDE